MGQSLGFFLFGSNSYGKGEPLAYYQQDILPATGMSVSGQQEEVGC